MTSRSTIEPGASSMQDGLCIMAHYQSFKQVKETIEEALDNLTIYYTMNSLHVNPEKTQVTAFHLRNKEEHRSLKVMWNETELENTAYLKYLGVTLDRSPCYQKTHTEHENEGGYPQQLTSRWGENPSTIRMTTLALRYSMAEYAATVWARSGPRTKPSMPISHRMSKANQRGGLVFAIGNSPSCNQKLCMC